MSYICQGLSALTSRILLFPFAYAFCFFNFSLQFKEKKMNPSIGSLRTFAPVLQDGKRVRRPCSGAGPTPRKVGRHKLDWGFEKLELAELGVER